ncbi:hypothetical protein JYT60_00525 [bacterium AH-315-C08]|nr:hypothetical protein [bacterium AH-315-C08]
MEKPKDEILHGACAERSRSIQNDKKCRFVILEERSDEESRGYAKFSAVRSMSSDCPKN